MDAREQRGLEIATKSKLTHKNGLWLVPSQHSGQQYTVDTTADEPRCTCRDFEFRRARCKHIIAVQVTVERTKTTTTKTTAKGKTKTVIETVKVKRLTYAQAWTSYNASQVGEKREFQVLLYELCAGLEAPIQGPGRPRVPLADMIFAAVFKIYSTFSSRRFMSDLREAHTKGFVSEVPHYNTISRYLESETLTAYLKHLITQSSLPLKDVEHDFAVDSSGFSTMQFSRWFDTKYGKDMDYRQWLKLHLMCGTRTHIVTSVEVSRAYAGDSPYFKPLVEQTARNGFKLAEISADKAYLSGGNIRTALQHGAAPFIPFKVNSNPDRGGTIWRRLFHYYNYKRDDFLAHYHKRSNVESTFSMIKSRFGERLRSKTETAQINEALCKVLAHNVCVVIQSIHELNITAPFAAEVQLAS